MGTLIYLMGPSGSGKDSLLRALREQQDAAILVAHRYITRPADAGGENHIALTSREFALRKQYGLFALDWRANGHDYGIGIEIESWLTRGMNVIINGSRADLANARQRYGTALYPVCLTVSQDVLRQRLQERGRECDADIEQRLQRALACQPDERETCHHLSNDGPLEQTTASLLQLIGRLPAVNYAEAPDTQTRETFYAR